VKSRKEVDHAEADLAAMRKLKSAFPGGHVGALFFSVESGEGDVFAYSRMFAPGAGVVEDPATGSAAGPLGCYMVRHRLVPRERASNFVNLQGVEMGRPSRLHMRITQDDSGTITRVQVGGKSVRAGEGQIDL
jgi:trans-2,3-dihydro-3-hydroxyanthranilate isomerase